MFITIPWDYRETWVCYALTDCNGAVFFVDIVRFTDLMMLRDVVIPDGNPVVTMTVVDKDVDRLKLANRMVPKFQHRIVEIVKAWSHGNKKYGNPVICNETGEQFASLTACADAHNLSYSQLASHLKGMRGYKTVKGKTYRKGSA